MIEIKPLVAQTPLCRELNSHELSALLAYSTSCVFPENHLVSRQGEPSKGIYIVLSGSLQVTTKTVTHDALPMAELATGDFFGESILLADNENLVSVKTSTTSELVFVPALYFEMLTQFSPETKYKINQAIVNSVIAHLCKIQKQITLTMKTTKKIATSLLGHVVDALSRLKKITLAEADVTLERLHTFSFFNRLTESQFQLLLRHMEVYEAEKNVTLLKEEDKQADVYFILRGAIQARIKFSPHFAKVAVLTTQSLFANTILISHQPTCLEFTTCERAIFLKIPAAFLETLKNENDVIWFEIHNVICQSIVELDQAAIKLEQRIQTEVYNR